MQRYFPAVLLIALSSAVAALAQPPENKLRLKIPPAAEAATEEAPATDAEVASKASYGIGAEMGANFKKIGTPVNVEMLIKGLQDAFAGKELQFNEKELGEAIDVFQKTVGARYQEKVAGVNKSEGDKFLADNGKKAGVTTLPSGLQYKVLKQSAGGKSPVKTDAVTTHYHGTFVDGTVFDSSVARGIPATFPVTRVIKGWTEALQLMKEGDKWQLFVPSALAYGAPGYPEAQIGPNQTLIFELELIKVQPAQKLEVKPQEP